MLKKIILGIFIGSFHVHARETDQFMAADKIIKDSTDVLNNYFIDKMQKAVNHANEEHPEKIKCPELANDVLGRVIGRFSISQVSNFATASPLVDKYPDSSVSDSDYIRSSIYRNATWLHKRFALARTININGIYVGTDKLGHFALLGRTYYHYYLDFIEDGESHDEAFRHAILKGMDSEIGVLGYGLIGVLAFGDLEGNYQGLKFAIDMCRGPDPYLLFTNGVWEMNRHNTFDLRKYFNPRMDESYNISLWRPYLYQRIKNDIKKEYCAVKNNPRYLERMSRYFIMMTPTLHDELIQEKIFSQEKFRTNRENIDDLCNL